MQLIQTSDSTLTVECPEYGQSMHSISGAYEEALLKHVYPSKILEKGDNITVLDTGFGIGYNSLALIKAASELPRKIVITIHALEFDRRYLPFMKQIRFNDSRDRIYTEIICSLEGKSNNQKLYKINFHFGDARKSLQKFAPGKFDAVFHDPFSPSKNPELWTTDFFILTANVMKPEGILTTYSSAPQIRAAMKDAGLKIGRGPSVGPKREGTIAGLEKVPCMIQEKEILEIIKKPSSAPYRDPHLNCSREDILAERLKRKKEL